MVLAPGTKLGIYEIQSLLGAGGMGEVYRATDTKLGRDVALKLLAHGALDKVSPGHLLREAQTASSLSHPNICTIHQVGKTGNDFYVVMELIEGRSLSDLITAMGLSMEIVTRYGTQIADALAHAHDRGIVHRDLKGSNVMVTPEGRVKVLDFGLATRLDRDKHRVNLRQLLGSSNRITHWRLVPLSSIDCPNPAAVPAFLAPSPSGLRPGTRP